MEKNTKLIILFHCIIFTLFSCKTEDKNQQIISDNDAITNPVDSIGIVVDSTITLSNENSVLKIAQFGGTYIDFHFKKNNTNPYTWGLTNEQMPPNNQGGAVFRGHFLCLGRWGSPTEGEIKAGVPHNGQASNSLWGILSQTENRVVMHASAPLDGLSIERIVELDSQNAVYLVTEKVTNTTSVFRINNIVQHATIGPPFLDTSTIVNTNATNGFLQKQSYPEPHSKEYIWPDATIDDMKIDLRKSDTKLSYVSTHIFDEKIGWITACNSKKKLLLGYIWNTGEYPWLNVWNQVDGDKPVAKGLEFGTTGIGRSYQEILAVDTRFHDYNSFEPLDAKETVYKSFICFLLSIPIDFTWVENVSCAENRIQITEAESKRKYTILLHNVSCKFIHSD